MQAAQGKPHAKTNRNLLGLMREGLQDSVEAERPLFNNEISFKTSSELQMGDKTVSWDGKRLGDEDCKTIADMTSRGGFMFLEKLSLGANSISDAGFTALAEVFTEGGMAQLEWLSLTSNRIGDNGTIAFSDACASGALSRLDYISLDWNPIGDPGLSALSLMLAAGGLPRLRYLFINHPSTDLLTACSSRGIVLNSQDWKLSGLEAPIHAARDTVIRGHSHHLHRNIIRTST